MLQNVDSNFSPQRNKVRDDYYCASAAASVEAKHHKLSTAVSAVHQHGLTTLPPQVHCLDLQSASACPRMLESQLSIVPLHIEVLLNRDSTRVL